MGDHVYELILAMHMHIYSIVNVENLKPYGTSMLDQETNEEVIPIIKELEPQS